ncbi:hypothetical protein ACLB2K_030744 [Fragaria x ananassa]
MASISSKTDASKARRWRYDVFFSFRRENRKNNIIFSTKRRLERRGFITYIDDQMSTEDSISSTCLPAIEESRFAIILLSPTYASFGCCLEELAKICECMKDQNRILPVFYRVDLNDVNYLMRIFERAFTEHQNGRRCVSSEKVYQWRDALRKVGSFSGLSAENYEYIDAFIADAIVESVCTKLQPAVEILDINMGDLDLFEATQATVELEPTISESNEKVEVDKVIRQATIEIEPTMPKPTKDLEAAEPTPPATNGNSSQFFGGPAEPSSQWKHDVFLSFRGEDTRKGFLSHLYHELQNTKVIRTFKDDEQLGRGKDISHALLTAIEESRFAIIVLSENYAFSAWCLDELTKIFHCMEGKDTILPIFYRVDPCDVRYQKNSYEVAFTLHKNKARHGIEKVNQWRADLTKVANLSGWDSKNYRSERELIEDIVKFVLKEVLQASSTTPKTASD